MKELYIVKLYLNGKRVYEYDKALNIRECAIAYADYLLTHFGGDDVVRVEISKI